MSELALVRVTVRYDSRLQEITGEREHSVVISDGAVFLFLLTCIFSEFPEMGQQYAPGMLSFTVNGLQPSAHSQLFDGDEVLFEAAV